MKDATYNARTRTGQPPSCFRSEVYEVFTETNKEGKRSMRVYTCKLCGGVITEALGWGGVGEIPVESTPPWTAYYELVDHLERKHLLTSIRGSL